MRNADGTGRKCIGTTNQGTRCRNDEADGLEYCVQHAPDELLEEAEELTGIRRCRHSIGMPDACTMIAVEGTDPPCCKVHGANLGGGQLKGAMIKVHEGHMAERLVQILAEGGEKLLKPDPIGNPLDELLQLAAEMKAAKEMLRVVAAHLYSNDRMRYAHSKVGEQLRMEILLYERSLERLSKVLVDIAKLRIEDRLVGVREQTAQMLERALDAALNDSGVGLEGQDKARQAFRRHLRVVA